MEGQNSLRSTASFPFSPHRHYISAYWCHDKLAQAQQLKQHKLVLLQFCTSEICHGSHRAKIKMAVGLCSFCRLCAGPKSLPFKLSFLGWWLLPASLKHQQQVKFSHHITLIYLRPPFYTFKDPCDQIDPIWIIQDNVPISN